MIRKTTPNLFLAIGDTLNVRSRPEPDTYMTLSTASSGGGYPYDFDASPYSGTIGSQSCSDGMSDINYSMAVSLIKPYGSPGTEMLYGCCKVD